MEKVTDSVCVCADEQHFEHFLLVYYESKKRIANK